MPTFSPLTVSFRGNYVKIRLYQRQSPSTWRQYVPPKRRRNGNYTVCKREKPTVTKVTVTVCQKFEWTNVTGILTALEMHHLAQLGEKWGKGNAAAVGWEGGTGGTNRPTDLQLPKRLLSPLRDANQTGAPNSNFTCIKISRCS